MTKRNAAAPCLVFAVSILSAACAGDGSKVPVLDDGKVGPFPPRLSAIQANVFTPTCSPGCHEPGGISPFSMKTLEDSYGMLVNMPNSQGAADSHGATYLRVEPGAPQRSYIILKLHGAAGIVGDRMPLGLAPLDQDVIDTIAEWIRRGAQND